MAENTSAQTNSDALPDLHKKSFLGHLEDLRSTILWSILFLLMGIVIAIPLAPFLVEILSHPHR